MTNDELNTMRDQEIYLRAFSGPFPAILDLCQERLEREKLRKPNTASYNMDFEEVNISYKLSFN